MPNRRSNFLAPTFPFVLLALLLQPQTLLADDPIIPWAIPNGHHAHQIGFGPHARMTASGVEDLYLNWIYCVTGTNPHDCGGVLANEKEVLALCASSKKWIVVGKTPDGDQVLVAISNPKKASFPLNQHFDGGRVKLHILNPDYPATAMDVNQSGRSDVKPKIVNCNASPARTAPTRGSFFGGIFKGARNPLTGVPSGGLSPDEVTDLVTAINGGGTRGNYNLTREGTIVTVPQWWPWTDRGADMRPYCIKANGKIYVERGADGRYGEIYD